MQGWKSVWKLNNWTGIVTACAVPYKADQPVYYASLDSSHSHRKQGEAGLSISAQVARVRENQDVGQEDQRLLPMVTGRDHSPQELCTLCDAEL